MSTFISLLRNWSKKDIEEVDLGDERLKQDIQELFDRVTRCTRTKKRQYTGASKILHTMLPNLIVMWDIKIRRKLLGEDKHEGRHYAYEFLPLVQREVEESINTCMMENSLSREQAIRKISELSDGKTLAKLMDEFNYMKYTLGKQV